MEKMIIRGAKLMDEIIDFWKKEKPHIIGPCRYCKFYRRAACDCVIDFIDQKETDIKNYPWVDKIFEKRKEIFGF